MAAAPTPSTPAPASSPAPSGGGLFGAASNFFSGVQNAVQNTVNQVSSAASSVVHSVQNAAQSAVSTVQNTAASAVQSAQNTAASVVSSVQNTAASAVQSVQNTAASVVSSVQSGAQTVRNELVDRAAIAQERLASAATATSNAAASTVNQINQGVASFERKVDQTAADLAPKFEAVMTTDIRDVVTVDNALELADTLNGAAPKPTLTPEQQKVVDTASWIMNAPPRELFTYDNLLSAVDAVNGSAGRPEVSPLQENAARFTVGAALSVAETLEGFASLPQLGNTLGQNTRNWTQEMTAQGPQGDANRQAFLDSVHQFMSAPLDQHASNLGNFLQQSFIQPVLDVKESHGPAEAAGYAVAQIADVVLGSHGAGGAVDNVAAHVSANAQEAYIRRAVAKVDQIVADAATPPPASLLPPKPPSQFDNFIQSASQAWGNATGALGMYPDLTPLPKHMIAVTREDLLAHPELVKDLIRQYGAGTDFYVDPKHYTFQGNMTRYEDRIILAVGGDDGLRAWNNKWDSQAGLQQPGLSTTAHEIAQSPQVIHQGPGAVQVPGVGTAVQLNMGWFGENLSAAPALPLWSGSGWTPPSASMPTVAQELSQAYQQLGLPGMTP